jgi:hypothetical protein
MANWTEDAKQFTQDIIAKVSFDQAVTMLQATPIGLAFGIGDVFLKTHDVAVGMGLLALEAQQEALNLEKRGLENRQDQELKGLEHQQATERAEREAGMPPR